MLAVWFAESRDRRASDQIQLPSIVPHRSIHDASDINRLPRGSLKEHPAHELVSAWFGCQVAHRELFQSWTHPRVELGRSHLRQTASTLVNGSLKETVSIE